MAEKVSVREVRRKLEQGDGPLLVCAYADEEKCRKTGVAGALTYQQLRQRPPDIPKSREIVFFCG
jgi:hypothetical protein